MQFSRADNCLPSGNSIYMWEIKARENGDVLDMQGEEQCGVKDDPPDLSNCKNNGVIHGNMKF